MEIAQSRAVRHARIGHNADISFLEFHSLFFSVVIQMKSFYSNSISICKVNIRYGTVLNKMNTFVSQIRLQRFDNTVILI